MKISTRAVLVEQLGLAWPRREKQSYCSCNIDKQVEQCVWDTGKLLRLAYIMVIILPNLKIGEFLKLHSCYRPVALTTVRTGGQ